MVRGRGASTHIYDAMCSHIGADGKRLGLLPVKGSAEALLQRCGVTEPTANAHPLEDDAAIAKSQLGGSGEAQRARRRFEDARPRLLGGNHESSASRRKAFRRVSKETRWIPCREHGLRLLN